MSAAAHVVLVHGAWHDGSCWDELVRELQSRGLTASTVDLPSSGGAGDLAADACVVRDELDRLSGAAPLIVVGHSYGGCPVSEATAGRTDVSHLVYLCALQLDVGESAHGSRSGEPAPWIALDEAAGTCTVAAPIPVFYGDVAQDLAEQASGRLRPQTLASLAGTLTGAGWHTIPSTYIACSEDQAISYERQLRMAARADAVHTLASSHSPFLSRPKDVADILMALVAS